ncbi:MAG TPA: SDR family NAD(P)-dependent oxidoreductase [Polyangia bacterium]|jgi:NAD(P)-dependent dehydrogenase (short-subunit alcohol dehydrogenase family)|nr:SDR family NAD(P)-dependent oxidoreductase [Polyangia bacterium]
MHDRVALVTGGTSGIGLACVHLLVAGGARVALIGRDPSRGEAAVHEIGTRGGDEGRVLFVAADVADAEQVRHAVDTVLTRWGRLDHAVNSAAYAPTMAVPTAELPEVEFDRTLAVNLRGAWLSMKYEIAAMLKSGGGSIVNVSSANGLTGTPMAAAYCASKWALHGLSRTAATEYGARGVRINVVCPGPTRTPMLEGVLDQLVAGNTGLDRVQAESMYASHVPLGRIGEAGELAQAIVWLLSPGASFVNGAVLSVDGGFTSAAL